MKVYVVGAGEYSDWHVVGVCTSLEKGELLKQLHAGTIQEFEVDKIPEYPPGMRYWCVSMKKDGTAECVCKNIEEEKRNGKWGEGWHKGWSPVRYSRAKWINFYCWAKDEKHAIKIANERRAVLIERGDWITNSKEYYRRMKANEKVGS